MSKHTSSPVLCQHANEVPDRCECPDDCYCKTNTCKPKHKESTEDIANKRSE